MKGENSKKRKQQHTNLQCEHLVGSLIERVTQLLHVELHHIRTDDQILLLCGKKRIAPANQHIVNGQ